MSPPPEDSARPDKEHPPRDAKRVVNAFRRIVKRYDGAHVGPISSLADPPDAIRAAILERSGPVMRQSGPDAARTLVLLVELEAFVQDSEADLIERSMKKPGTLSSDERSRAKEILERIAEAQRAAAPQCAAVAGPHRQAEKARQIAPHGRSPLPVGAATDLLTEYAPYDRGQGEGILAMFLLIGYGIVRLFVEGIVRTAEERGMLTLSERFDPIPLTVGVLIAYFPWAFADGVIRGPATLHRLTLMFAGRPRPVGHAVNWGVSLTFAALLAIAFLIEQCVALMR